MRSTKLGCFRSHSWSLLRRGASAWFHGVWTWGVKVFEYWMISSLKIKLNCNWKFLRNWNVPLVLVEKPWWAGLMEFIWYDLDSECGRYWFFKWFLPLKIQINSKNQVLEGKISWKRVTLGPTAQATLICF